MSCTAGIDLGTTTIKVCIVENSSIVKEAQTFHEANVSGRVGVQNAKKIIEAAVELLTNTVLDVRKRFSKEVVRIGISGQQHGIVMWNSDSLQKGELDCSELWNWMYPGDAEAAFKLPRSTSNRVFPGYGMRTLCELASHADFDVDHHWDRCGNIMDYLACYLTGSDEVLMSESNAYCWGFSTGLQWNPEILAFVPRWIELPRIVRTEVGTFIKLGNCRIEPMENVPVGVAIADLHASIMSVRGHYHGADHAYLIIGTSSQLCFILSNTVQLPTIPITTHMFPYTDDLTLVAAASMNGGNALDAFLTTVSRWYEEATAPACVTEDINMSRILTELDEATAAATTWTHTEHIRAEITQFKRSSFYQKDLPVDLASSDLETSSLGTYPNVKSTFTTERGSEDTGVDIRGLRTDTTLITMLIGVCNGVVRNLFGLVPPQLLTSYGVRKLYVIGSARMNRFLVHIRRFLHELHADHIELVPAECETSAAYGVAL